MVQGIKKRNRENGEEGEFYRSEALKNNEKKGTYQIRRDERKQKKSGNPIRRTI